MLSNLKAFANKAIRDVLDDTQVSYMNVLDNKVDKVSNGELSARAVPYIDCDIDIISQSMRCLLKEVIDTNKDWAYVNQEPSLYIDAKLIQSHLIEYKGIQFTCREVESDRGRTIETCMMYKCVH